LGFEHEHGQREGDESGTDHDPLGVNAHAGVTELPPAGVLWRRRREAKLESVLLGNTPKKK
jgi:hypothetical protein